MPKRLSQEQVKQKVLEKGLVLVSEYINSSKKILIKCYCGNNFYSMLPDISAGKTKSCGCYYKNSRNEIIANIAKKKRGDYLEQLSKDIGNKYNLLTVQSYYEDENRRCRYKCLCDCGNITDIDSHQIKYTKSCGCLKNRKGKDCPTFKSDKDESKGKRSTSAINIWRKAVFGRDKYTCVICGQTGGKLNAHHLNGYNWCKSQRFDISNGVTLCAGGIDSCHKKFHKKYGNGNNTIAQFIKYVSYDLSE